MIAPRVPHLLPVLALLALAGCSSDLTRSFGLVRDTPDEFTVTTRAPLSMPPDFSLRPPAPGAARPQDVPPSQAAAAILVPQGGAGASGAAQTAGERALVADAGPQAPADIRSRVDADAALAATSRSFADKLMFWKKPTPPGTEVDPQAEAQRLRENAALGRSPEVGDTPIIQRKPKTFFDAIF